MTPLYQIATFTVRTAIEVFKRIRETDRIDLRRASSDRLTWLARNTYAVEFNSDVEKVKEMQQLAFDEAHIINERPIWWNQPTWKY